MLVIGSVAMDQNGRATKKAKDLDLIATFAELNEFTRELRKIDGINKVYSVPYSHNKTVLRTDQVRAIYPSIVEVEIAWPGSTAEELLDMTKYDQFAKQVNWWTSTSRLIREARVPSLDVLYTLKMSHRYLKNSPHFEKTMTDIRRLRFWKAKIFNEDWYRRREKETYDHPNLNATKNDFFKMNEGVNYIYDHDSIHMAMAHLSTLTWQVGKPRLDNEEMMPAYKAYAGEGEVISSKTKFFECSEALRLYGVLEEAQVLALERSQIPYGQIDQYRLGQQVNHLRWVHGISPSKTPPSPRQSFDMALKKVCTSITSGWFREFAWESFERVNDMYEEDYVDRFWDAVKKGIVFRTQHSHDKEKEFDDRRNSRASGHSSG